MLKRIIFVALLFCFVKSEDTNDEATQNRVKPRVLTNENFKSTLDEPELGTFVMFQAPWCGRK